MNGEAGIDRPNGAGAALRLARMAGSSGPLCATIDGHLAR
jgi:hypothetical protein